MEKKPLRILRIVSVMDRGGIETQIMNMYRKLDRNRFQFDFLITRDKQGVFDSEIKEMGGKIFRVPSVKSVGLIRFIKNINVFFKEHKEYSIVHSHMNTWSGLFLGIAKYHGVKVRIAQSHSAQQGYKAKNFQEVIERTFKRTMKIFIKNNATHYWAVGKAAGEWLYGKKIAKDKLKVVPNAKDLHAYKFNEEKRKELRRELNIPQDSLVIGHVGSFFPVKNHTFLIDLFIEILKEDNNAFLCLVGDGPLRKEIENTVTNLSIKDNVKILGIRNDVNSLMSTFDVLFLPSIFEGIPNVVIEAQASSLPCIISDSITDEVDMEIGLVKYKSLERKKDWTSNIHDVKTINRPIDTKKINDRGYDINQLMVNIEEFYLTVL